MVSAQQVKELREVTGAGMMDCKKALGECDGNMEKAIDWLREKGISKAAKKGDRIAAEGLSRVAIEGNIGIIFEVNSETDFVAKNEQFISLLDTIQAVLIANKPTSLEATLALKDNGKTIEEIVMSATATIGEKITLRRVCCIEKSNDQFFGSYIHMGGKISALVVMKGHENSEVAKDIAMQVASMSPKYVTRDEMPKEIVDHERSIQVEIVKNDEKLAGKPENVLNGIIEGKVSKTLKDLCLVEQEYFKNGDLKVGQYCKEKQCDIVSFVRYAVGEGIEKREENFIDEVMSTAFAK